MYGLDIKAVSFINENYLLIGSFGDPRVAETRLYVLDLRICGRERVSLKEVNYCCILMYPPYYPWIVPLAIQIRADPMSPWTPPVTSQAPFFVGQDLRLFVITMYMGIGNEVAQYDLFVLSHTLLSLVDGLDLDDDRHIFRWREWGPMNTRFMESPRHSAVWVCFVCGTKFVTLAVHDDLLESTSSALEVWDFAPLSIRKERFLVEDAEVEWHDNDLSCVRGPVFKCDVVTSLPYRVVRRAPPGRKLGDVLLHALCSEDNLILVDVRFSILFDGHGN